MVKNINRSTKLFNLRHLLSALEIQNNGSISEAAKHMHLNHRAITQGINKLENSIGLLLCNQTNSGMYSTKNSSHFLLSLERAFKHLHDFASMLFVTEKIKKHSLVRSVTSRHSVPLSPLLNYKFIPLRQCA
jgi:DNA-binding transcriptional LysR family regulator